MNAPARHPLTTAPEPARFSAADFSAMIGAGMFDSWTGNVELDDGVVVRMNAKYAPHAAIQSRTYDAISKSLRTCGSELQLRVEPSIILGGDVVRSPDIAVITTDDDVLELLPADRLRLAIEIADSSLSYDLGPKARDYAAAGIPEYWVVDLRARTVHLHAEPSPDGYLARASARFGEAFASAALGTFTVEG